MAEFIQHVFQEVNISTENLQGFFGAPPTNIRIGVDVSKRRTSRFSTSYLFQLHRTLSFTDDISVDLLWYSPRLNIWNGYNNRFQVSGGEFASEQSFPVGRMLKPIVWDAAGRNEKTFGVEIQAFRLPNERIEDFHLYFGTLMLDTSTNTWRTYEVTNWHMFQEIHSKWNQEDRKWSQEAPSREEKRSE